MDNMNDSELFGRVIKVNIARPNAMKSQAGLIIIDVVH